MNEGKLPLRIVFFRDGVSEGEFAIVRERELHAMRGRFYCIMVVVDDL